MSGILSLKPTMWLEIYDKLMQDERLSLDLKITLERNRLEIEELYRKIEGEWWRTGTFRQKLYRLENWFGKASYEMRQEQKALAILIDDIDAVIKELEVIEQ